jgi:hypothetical protein
MPEPGYRIPMQWMKSVRDYPLNVQCVGNRGTITFTHLRAKSRAPVRQAVPRRS